MGLLGVLSPTRRREPARCWMVVCCALLAAGCGSGDEPEAGHSTKREQRTTQSPSPTSVPSPRPSDDKTAPSQEPATGGCRPNTPRPGNGRIAFYANATTDVNSEEANAPGDIFTAAPDGSDVRRLTDTLDSTHPEWSPDGQQLAFLRTAWRRNYKDTLWVMDADGSGARSIVRLGSTDGGLDWSPDGRRIAVGSFRGIFIVDLRSREVRQLPWRVRGWDAPWSPRWSADGKHLAVTSAGKGPGPDDYTRTLGVFTIDSRTGGDAARAPGVKNLLGHDWSWTDCRLVYAAGLATRGGECNGDLHVTGTDLAGPAPLPPQRCQQAAPVWSPDGEAIAYLSAGGIWVANADGTGARQVIGPLRSGTGPAGGLGALLGPAWQPVP